jgi:uncharacterized protein YggE
MATITVNGYGEVSVPPDEATVTLGVECVAATPRDAMSEVAEQARALVGLLDELEIPPAKRSTTGVLVSEAGEHDPQGQAAAENARARAEAVAAGLGVRLGAIVEAKEEAAFHPVPRQASFAPLAMEGGPPIEAGEATIAGNVSVTFQVEPA